MTFNRLLSSLAGLAAAATISSGTSWADELPAFHIAAPETLIAPGGEDAVLSASATTPTYRVNQTAWEVEDLARALQYDPRRMYEFVRNEVTVHPLFGLQKGARGAVIDLSGTPFDQADLLVQLLRESISNPSENVGEPVTSANYVYGTITLNGTDFSDWFGISDAQAACRVLAAGGFPARVNGATNCATLSGGVSSVEMRHVWVEAVVGGQTLTYDPAFKRYEYFAGIDLDAAMGYSAGAASTAATATTQSSDQGVPFAAGINTAGIESLLVNRSNTLRTSLESAANYDRPLEEIIGGRRIIQTEQHIDGPDTSTAAPGTYSGTSWTEIPDRYRTTLTIEVGRCANNLACTGDDVEVFETVLVDEIYGSRMALQPNDFSLAGGAQGYAQGQIYGCVPLAGSTYVYRVNLTLDDTTNIATFDGACDPEMRRGFSVRLKANHPYAGDNGAYMDSGYRDDVDLVTRAAIVSGWGDVSPNYQTHMRRGVGRWRINPYQLAVVEGESGPPTATGTGAMRDGMAASWLVQMSRMMEMQTAIAGAVGQHHHSLGLAYAQTDLADNWDDCVECQERTVSINNEAVLLSVASGASLTLEADNALQKSGLDRAVAAAAATLEGSVMQQQLDAVSATSTASKFTWANGGPDAVWPQPAGYPTLTQLEDNDEDPNAGFIGPMDTLVFEPGDEALLSQLITSDGLMPNSPECALIWETIYRCDGNLVGPITAYLTAGYTVIVPRDLFLGPGRRCGPWATYDVHHYDEIAAVEYCERNASRGSAMIAYRSGANGEDIAHVVTQFGESSKGAGAPAPPMEIDVPSIPVAADILEDQSNVAFSHNINQASGQLDTTTGPLVTTGIGEFPYALSLEMSFGSGARSPDDEAWNHNWEIDASLSSSAMEVMGSSRMLTAAPSIVAMRVMQDLYSFTASATSDRVRREVGAMIINNWWSRQGSGNVLTVTYGGTASQFTRWLETSDFLPPAGSNAVLTQTGQRFVHEPFETSWQVQGAGPLTQYRPSSLTWFHNDLSFSFETAGKDRIDFEYWAALNTEEGEYPQLWSAGLKRGFRASQWTFPTGFNLSFTYEQAGICANQDGGPYHPDVARQCQPRLASVVNSAGRTLNFEYEGDTDRLTGARDENNRFGGENPSGDGFIRPDGSVLDYDITYVSSCVSATGAISYHLLDQNTVNCGNIAQFITGIEQPEDAPGAPSYRYTYDLDPANPLRGSWRTLTGEHRRANGSYAAASFHSAVREGAVRDPLGNTSRSYYDEQGRQSSAESPRGVVSQSVYDGLGRAVEERVRERTSASYLAARYEARSTSEYDQRHNVRFQRQYPGTDAAGQPGTASALVTESRYEDPLWPDYPTTVIDPRGETTTTSYHATYGYPAIQNGASGEQTRYTYTSQGLVETTTVKVDASVERITTIAYDTVRQEPQSVTVSANNTAETLVTSFDWTLQGWLEAVHAPHPTLANQTVTMRAVHDAVGRVVRVDSADGRAEEQIQRFAYDTNGNLIRVEVSTSGLDTGPWQVTTASYSPTGQLLTATDPAGDMQVYSYDTVGRLDTAADGEGRTTRQTYLPDSLVDRTYEAWGTAEQVAVVQQAYTALGERDELTQAKGLGENAGVSADNALYDTQWAFDGFNRLTSVTFPSPDTGEAAPVEQFTQYDANSNLLERITRAGDTISHSYDASNRLVTKTTPQGVVTTSYNLAGEPTRVTGPNPHGAGQWALDYAYDFAGRQLSETQTTPEGTQRTVAYQYDAAGNRTRITWPDGFFVAYEYDAASRLTAVKANASELLAQYTYDAQGRLSGYYVSNAAGAPVGAVVPGYDADGDSDLTSLAYAFEGAPNVRFDYAYDRSGYLTGQIIDQADWRWSPATSLAGYQNASYTANRLDQYTAVTGQTYQYDLNGNLTCISAAADCATYGDDFQYSAENQLLYARLADAEYSYGPAARRVRKNVGGVVTDFLHAGDMEIAEYGASGQLLRRYIPGAGVDQRVAMIECNGSASCAPGASAVVTRYYFADRQGNVLAVANEDGTLHQRFMYTPFGVEMIGDTSGNPFRYTGRRYDPETGLYYYRARYYNADLGRFLQVDPIGYQDQWNLYAYVGNNPLNATDPTGEACYPWNNYRIAGTSTYGQFCQNARYYGRVDRFYPAISSRTTFFRAASLISDSFASVEHFGSGSQITPATRRHITEINAMLRTEIQKAAEAMLSGQWQWEDTVEENDNRIVHIE